MFLFKYYFISFLSIVVFGFMIWFLLKAKIEIKAGDTEKGVLRLINILLLYFFYSASLPIFNIGGL